MRIILALLLALASFDAHAQTLMPFVSGSTSGGGGTCISSILDSFPASPGAYTAAGSLRKLFAAYAGSAVQLQRSSDSATLDVGFSGCDPDTSVSSAFCTEATVAIGTASARVAFPTGSVIHIWNKQGGSGAFYAAGNSSVTATTASGTPLPPNQGASITVGANTNLAVIGGAGYGLNGNAPSGTVVLTNCGVSKWYDQINSNHPAQTTLAKQLGYISAASTGGKPIVAGCLTCQMPAPDAAVYKTSVVETFTVMSFGNDYTTSNFNYGGVIYPSTGTSAASTSRWGLINWASPDILTPAINGSNGSTFEGFGNVWRGQNLTQYDYSTGGITRWNGGTQFFSAGSGTPTYPTAVGLYVMGDAAGNGTPGTMVEWIVASGTQTARNSVSANQVSYWGITTGTASSVALTNPLGDGWNFAAQQLGGFAPSPPGPGTLTINGNAYNTEGAWNNYSSWLATNGSTASGQLGDLYRFQITGQFDNWDGTFRSEVDGAGGSAQFANGTTFWIAYAVLIEPGTAYNSQWNILGQMHLDEGTAVCCVFNVMSNTNSGCTDCWTIFTYNATTGSQTSTTSNFSLTRNRWYHFVFQVNVSTSGTADTFNVWLDTVTPGTMVQVVSNTGATLFGGSTSNQHTYWKYGIYRQTGVSLPTFAPRYGNMQACSQGAGCTSLYGASDLSAQTTTPLADPAHLFLLKRDLDGSNDNTPMWLNEAA